MRGIKTAEASILGDACSHTVEADRILRVRGF
jgi:hypothetical protein